MLNPDLHILKHKLPVTERVNETAAYAVDKPVTLEWSNENPLAFLLTAKAPQIQYRGAGA